MAADTKQTILDTAERLIAEKGIDAVSLRSITSEASVNLAAVHSFRLERGVGGEVLSAA
jgi:AcrR family transcriptional regulator